MVPEWPAPLSGQNPSVARRAESRQLSQGLSQRRNGHQLGVAEGWDWSSGVTEAKEVGGGGGVTWAGIVDRGLLSIPLLFEREAPSGLRGPILLLHPPHTDTEKPPYLPTTLFLDSRGFSATSFPQHPLPNLRILTLVSAASDFRVLFIISSSRCEETPQ